MGSIYKKSTEKMAQDREDVFNFRKTRDAVSRKYLNQEGLVVRA